MQPNPSMRCFLTAGGLAFRELPLRPPLLQVLLLRLPKALERGASCGYFHARLEREHSRQKEVAWGSLLTSSHWRLHERASFTEMLKWNMLEFCAEPHSRRAAVNLPSPITSPTKFQLNTLESHPCIRRASNPFGMIFLQKKVGGGVGRRTCRAKST